MHCHLAHAGLAHAGNTRTPRTDTKALSDEVATPDATVLPFISATENTAKIAKPSMPVNHPIHYSSKSSKKTPSNHHVSEQDSIGPEGEDGSSFSSPRKRRRRSKKDKLKANKNTLVGLFSSPRERKADDDCSSDFVTPKQHNGTRQPHQGAGFQEISFGDDVPALDDGEGSRTASSHHEAFGRDQLTIFTQPNQKDSGDNILDMDQPAELEFFSPSSVHTPSNERAKRPITSQNYSSRRSFDLMTQHEDDDGGWMDQDLMTQQDF